MEPLYVYTILVWHEEYGYVEYYHYDFGYFLRAVSSIDDEHLCGYGVFSL